MAIQSYTSPIDIKWNTDNQGKKIKISITSEQHMIAQGYFTLNQIPDYGDKVIINGLYEIEDGTPDETQFKVNYDMGIVNFHESHEAEVITINQYSGRGIWSISSKKIYDDITGQPIDTQKTLQDFINKVKEYQFENFDSTKVYKPNAIVYYHGSTFVCLKQTLNYEIPTNTEYWTPFATGTYWRGLYDDTKTYDLRDIVYFDDEKATYICIQQTTVGILPTNTEYWEKISSVKEVSDYAQAQGDYAKTEGDYAKSEGDYAKNQGDYAKQQGDYITNTFAQNENNRQTTFETNETNRQNTFDTNESERQSQFDVLKNDAITATNNANQATTNANTATANYTDIVEQTKKIYKAMVNTYADILTTYPTPEIGWTVVAKDTHIEYRWDGFTWIDIGINDAFAGYNIVVGSVPPTNPNLIWVDAPESVRYARIIPSEAEPSDIGQIWWELDN